MIGGPYSEEAERQAERRAARLHEEESDMHPLLKERLGKPRSNFIFGRRIRMNIVPMFLTVFIPWGVFVFASGVCGFSMLYKRPVLAETCICLLGVFWLVTVAIAIRARKHEPDPTWYTYLAIITGLMLVSGLGCGLNMYTSHVKPYLQLSDLKVAKNVDASRASGENYMDTGVIYFGKGNDIDSQRTSHFKLGTMYCVAPIVTNGATPETLSYDFWVVGKDCCAVGASDFRCGAWSTGSARAGIRVMSDEDQTYYRLAVDQALTTYNIASQHPLFFEWAVDPLTDLAIWNRRCYRNYLFGNGVAFVVCLFGMCMAAAKFAFLGRGPWKKGFELYQDPRFMGEGTFNPAMGSYALL